MDVSALTVNYHAMLTQSPDPCVLIEPGGATLADVNLPAETMLGRTRAQLLGMPLADLCPARQPGGDTTAALLSAQLASAGEGRGRLFPLTLHTIGARELPCEALFIRLPVPGLPLVHGRLVDISARLLAEQLRDGQSAILELISTGAPLQQVLERIVALIETQSPGVLCSVLLLDDDGVTVRPACGPSLPAAYMAMLDGLHIGPGTGSCGSAMFDKKLAVATDIFTDPCWAPYVALAAPYGLRACWSTPIIPDGEHVLGSFAMYYREVRAPQPADISLIGTASHLAGVAIERSRRERELARHREHLEELVGERTAALTAAVERADRSNADLSNALATLSRAKDELVRRDKLAALGVMVAGVAHELNTPIGNSVVAATSLAERTHALRDSLASGLRRSELERFLAEASEAGDLLVRNLKRAATLVAGFKQIAVDHASAERRRFSLSELLVELAAPLRVAARPSRVELKLDVAPGLAMDSYPGPLSQAVTELFENCLAHAFNGCAVTADGAPPWVWLSAGAAGDGWLRVAVADNGAGMDPATQSRIYDPFFTTALGAGRSGLGLHVLHDIVSNVLGGRIEVDSAPGAGARFSLLLPAVAPARPPLAEAAS